MTSLRDSPIRRQPPRRPPWLIPALAVLGVLVVVGLLYAIVALVRGTGDSTATSEETPSPCVTRTVIPADSLPQPAKVTVNVYNASAVSGLAGRTATDLRKAGFKIVKVANDPAGRTVEGIGEIRFGPKASERAQLLAAYVPGARLVALDRTGRKVDLVLGSTFAGLAPQAEVDAVLTAPSPVATGPGCAASDG